MNFPRASLRVPWLRPLTLAAGLCGTSWHCSRFLLLRAVPVSAQLTICTLQQRYLQQQQRGAQKPSQQPAPVQRRPGGASPQTVAAKVKAAGRDITYLIVVLVGLGVTGGLFYVVFQELFSSSSPSKIYGEALEKCRHHSEVIGVFGEPIKGYGETTRRGRRQHVSHFEYMQDGHKCMRLKFYIEGSEPRKQGTVHLEVRENPESGKYEFRYIFVDIDTYPRRTIVIEDNRS